LNADATVVDLTQLLYAFNACLSVSQQQYLFSLILAFWLQSSQLERAAFSPKHVLALRISRKDAVKGKVVGEISSMASTISYPYFQCS
jgi:hypothetical protein